VAGILYAADPEGFGASGCAPADVVNLSLGALVPRSGNGTLLAALTRAVDFATSRGAVVVAAAGGDELDLGQAGDLVVVPAQSGKALAVSATGPVGFALGATNFRRIASYTNFGEDLVYVAGPGGDFVLPGSATCTVAGVTAPCWTFDLVLSTNVGGTYTFASGTSPATAAVSGIAALALSGHPGISRGTLETLLARTADDEGKPGHDELYGHGFANAFRACVE
jgi:subtilisin family serine protease